MKQLRKRFNEEHVKELLKKYEDSTVKSEIIVIFLILQVLKERNSLFLHFCVFGVIDSDTYFLSCIIFLNE